MGTGERIPNLPADAWTPEVQALFPLMLPHGSTARGSDFNSILVLVRHPELAEPYLRFNAALAKGVDLSARLKEIAILRVAWRRGSEYEWVHHAISALRTGLTPEHLAALMQAEPAAIFTSEEQAVVAATDDICLSGGIGDATWPALSNALTTKQAMEMLFVVGCYIMLGSILKTAGAPVEPQVAAHFDELGLQRLRPALN
ncbi:carboxymuconolactone decarboxylase family protein [Novosphingobium sp. TH158]|uniref:carboxymuconolactone decarboxylase family protein n=1 Tax=Novosphingobium sp. TH158 TaxID=2067455 RepID=UPI000C7C42BD|nr:carboxymuconolactone decarboxylase family protein [Novosphingobium sp. TH158]PLK26786.1 carboxymuconolactone decarboxylase [Novosphingobium sp. TH158]